MMSFRVVKEKNHIGALQKAGDTSWSSHLKSVSNLLKIFSATCEALLNIIEDGTISTQRADADATYKAYADVAYEALTSFEFVLILHMIRKLWILLICFVMLFKIKIKTY